MSHATRPEVLAPAGNRSCLEAAVAAGADAVYFGLTAFNARARADNFEPADLSETLQFLHARGVKGYVTLNTLVFDAELARLEQTIRICAAAGVDAVIVQDLGVARLLRRVAPELPLHASTQMTCTDAASVELARELGARRVVLARELSLQEIAAISASTDVELEVFVHGALCIAYSGQCLTSEAIGGRSANRGACAQACRLPYELVVDGAVRDLGDRAYLLSPEDLDASSLIPELARLGVRSLKIEGRLKGPDYVAAVTRLYRDAVDAAVRAAPSPTSELHELALQTYSRGSGPGFLNGTDHQRLVDGKSCDHRGVQVGTFRGLVQRHGRTWAKVVLERGVARGDGLLIEGGRAGEGEVGGRVWEVLQASRAVEQGQPGQEVLLWFGPKVHLERDTPGRRVFRTNQPSASARIAELVERAPHATRIDVRVTGQIGELPVFEATSERGVTASVSADVALTRAEKRPIDGETLRAQLGRLGGTGFCLGELRSELPADVMLPVSALNRARRELVARLQTAAHVVRSSTTTDVAGLFAELQAAPEPPEAPGGLFVLCRNREQAAAAVAAGADGVYLDFLELTGTGSALRDLRAAGAFVAVAPPRIRKPGEDKVDRYLLGLEPDAILVRGLGALRELGSGGRDLQLIGDFSLNVTNRLSVEEVLSRGLTAFTPSFDLDAAQLVELLSGSVAKRAEVVIHHPMPLFHMEHCVIAALLSEGRDYKSCGRPCEQHRLSLRDRAGMEHPVEADVGCRNTVFHAAPQSAAELVPKLREQGVRRFRVELVRESAAQVSRVVGAYRRLVDGVASGAGVRSELQTVGSYGVVRGSLRVLP